MRWNLVHRRHPYLFNTMMVALTAGVLGACSSDVSRFGSPIFAGSTDNQRAILGSNGSPPEATDAVERGALTPVGADAASSYAQDAASGAPDLVSSRGWSAAGAPTVTVGPGETAISLSRRYGVPVDVILAANRLSGPHEIRPGTRLVIPTYVRTGTSTAPPAAAAPAGGSADSTAGPGAPPMTLQAQADALGGPGGTRTSAGGTTTYRVQAGDTAWSISQRFGIGVSDLVTANDLPPDGSVRFGQLLRIPGAAGASVASADGAGAPDARPAPPAGVAEALAKPERKTRVAALPAELARGAKTMTDAMPEAAVPESQDEVAAIDPGVATDGADGFRWPVRGRIIAGFGKQPDGARNDGINLAVPAGTPIKAAEQGTVIYAGNELQGYGNLVLVQHKDGWVSAYAHAEEILVKRGEGVKRGQVIARAGASGSVTQPQLHFELRKGSKPVDPLPHLSGA